MIAKNRIVQIVFIALVFILCLIITMPASQAYKWGFYGDELTMYGMQGTILNGKAKVVDIDDYRINNASWSWRPLALFLGQLSLAWQLDDPAIKANGIAKTGLFNDYQVSDAHLLINAAQLQSYLPKGFRLDGNIELHIDQLSFEYAINSVTAQAKTDTLVLTTPVGVVELNNLKLLLTGSSEK